MGNPNIKSSKITVGDDKVPFVKWYNEVFHKANAKDARCPPAIHKDSGFAVIFDQPKLWLRPELTLNEFIAFFLIFCNETGGKFKAIPEIGDAKYFFEPKKGVKSSYNTIKGNRPAGDLLVAMGKLDKDKDAADVKAWNGEVYPKDSSKDVQLAAHQCDFYKYRGRGLIQTTLRSNYLATVDKLLKGKKSDDLTDEELTKAVCEDPNVYLGMVKLFFSAGKWPTWIAALNVDPPKAPGFYDVGHHVSGGVEYAKRYEWRCQTLLAALTDAGYDAK
jgi:hypothetical protein